MTFRLLSVIPLWFALAGLAVGENSLNCNFDGSLEENPRCGWSNDVTDDFDWTLNRFPTLTPFTGPSGDHTTGAGNYLYTEATDRAPGDAARIYSPYDAPSNANAPASVTVLTFWYSMWQSFPEQRPNMGTLNVYLAYGASVVPTTGPVWSATGPHTGELRWKEARIMFRAPEPFRIIFEGVIGNGVRSDIGIDDVSVITTDIPLSCDFESSPLGDLCMLRQEEFTDDFDWTRQSGETPSIDTGPLSDHTFANSSGHYMFIETNRQMGVPATAQLTSLPYFKYSGECSIGFYYHAYGANVGQLRVLIRHDERNETETVVDGDSEDAWKQHEVSVPTEQGYYTFTFEGSRGDGNLGDIAIDDVMLTGARCSDVDHCMSEPCLNGGTCSTGSLGYECSCDAGWTGVNCQEDVDNCSPNECPEGYECVDLMNTYDCVCPTGYQGEGCSEVVPTVQQPAPINTNIDGVDPEKIPVIVGSCIGSFILIVTAAWFTATCIKQDGYRKKNAEVDEKDAEEGGGSPTMYVNSAFSPDEADKADEVTVAAATDAADDGGKEEAFANATDPEDVHENENEGSVKGEGETAGQPGSDNKTEVGDDHVCETPTKAADVDEPAPSKVDDDKVEEQEEQEAEAPAQSVKV